MPGSSYIEVRKTRTGQKRYRVMYRRGGRGFRLEYYETYGTPQLARLGQAEVDTELFNGRDPLLKKLSKKVVAPTKRKLLRDYCEDYLASRGKWSTKSIVGFGVAREAFDPVFGGRDPFSIKWPEVLDWTRAKQEEPSPSTGRPLKPSTVEKYLQALAGLLDFVGVEPNPARAKQISLGGQRQAEVYLPTHEELAQLCGAISSEHRLPFVLMVLVGGRPSEIAALAWENLHFVGGKNVRIHLDRTVGTKTRNAARWLDNLVPAWWVEALLAETPASFRQGRLFPGLSQSSLYHAIKRACEKIGLPPLDNKTFRHLWFSTEVYLFGHKQGRSLAEIAQLGGHGRKSVTLDVYTHMPPRDAEVLLSRSLEDAHLSRSESLGEATPVLPEAPEGEVFRLG